MRKLASRILFPLLLLAGAPFGHAQGTQHDRINLNQNASVGQQYPAAATITTGHLVQLSSGTTTVNGIVYQNIIETTTSVTSVILGISETTTTTGNLVTVSLDGSTARRGVL